MMSAVVRSGLGRRAASASHIVATLQQPAVAPVASRVRSRNGHEHQQRQPQPQHQQRRHASDHARRPKTALFFPGARRPPPPSLSLLCPLLAAMPRPSVVTLDLAPHLARS